MDIFFFQLVIIFVPGLIWERIDTTYGRSRPKEQWDVVRRSFMFGLASYGILFFICWLYSLKYGDTGLRVPQLRKEEAFIDANAFKLVSWASMVALVSGILWLYVVNNKMITWCLQRIKATKRYGDEDVWEFMFNSGRAEVEYIHIRDFEKQLAYSGWVESFSETEKQREIVLRNVEVRYFNGDLAYETARIYIARKADNIDIEFPYVVPKGKE